MNLDERSKYEIVELLHWTRSNRLGYPVFQLVVRNASKVVNGMTFRGSLLISTHIFLWDAEERKRRLEKQNGGKQK